MSNGLYIPNRINVGFQNRSDTYTKKLAYIIYYDSLGKLRKEASWQSWRDKNIPNEEFDNVPTEGFVLNRRAGGVEESYGYNASKTYVRVYDPRGFEFEITIDNLLFILENVSSIKGKGLEGKFVYSWYGTEMVLLPCSSQDYIKQKEYSSLIKSNSFVQAKDLIIGATYIDKSNNEIVYVGKFERYSTGYWHNDKFFNNFSKLAEYCDSIGDYTSTWNNRRSYDYIFDYGPVGKVFWFYHRQSNTFIHKQSISKYLIATKDSNCAIDYSDIYEKMIRNPNYSPIDQSATKMLNHTLESFKEYINKSNNWVFDKSNSRVFIHCYKEDGLYSYSCSCIERGKHFSIEELFNLLQPKYKEIYLKNGLLYTKEGA